MHAPLKDPPAAAAPAARSSNRRARRADRARQPVLHLVMPGLEVARELPRPRETVTAFLRRTGWARQDARYGWQFKKGLPTVLEINGEAVLRRAWRSRRIAAGDSVRFVSYPLGGGNNTAKQIVGLVALVAVSAFALWVPGALGLTGLAAYGATAAIGIGGSLLINALVAPKQGATNSPSATQDQIYAVQAQGNTAKLGQPLPVWYGRLKAYPDFAATPWGEFVGNDQYLNVLLSTTMGSMEYETIYIDDTILWDAVDGIGAGFDAQVAFYEPGADIGLFPVNVDQSSEVSGQEFPDGSGYSTPAFGSPASPGAPLGPFVANPSGTQAQAIAVDFVFPAGCFGVDPGDEQVRAHPAAFRLIADYAPVDDAGAVIGAFVTLFDVTRVYASKAPVRDSVKVNVTPGRYTVRVSRGDAALPTDKGVSMCIWAGLRSFLKGSNSFPDVSTIAIRLKASQSTQGSYKFGVLGTRKLPVWTGSTFELQATRNNAWAFLDAVTSEQYGSGLPISKVDFSAVVNHAAGCTSRGDTFDYRFGTAIAVPEAFDKILTASRARHFWLGDTVSIVRDEWRDVPTMLLTDREIVRNSTQVSFTMLGDEDPDAVIVEYIDQETWLPAQVQYPPNSEIFTAQNAEVKRVDGIVDRDQAFRECAFYYLQSLYRREKVELGVEYEGRAITFGSVVRVQSELPQSYGYGGAVVAVSGRTLTLNRAPAWDEAPFYIRLRQPNGTFFGPVACTRGADASRAVLDAASLAAAEADQATTLATVLARDPGGEDPSFELGTGGGESRLCVVLNGTPKGELCTLSLVVDDERVHATDLGDPPALPGPQYPSDARVPLIIGLFASFGQGVAEPKLGASWFPAAGAEYYVADVSYDGGANWAQVYEGADNQFDRVVTLAALTLRVQAITTGKLRGPYASVDLGAPTIEIAPGTVALASVIAGIRYQLTGLQSQFGDELARIRQELASVASNATARTWLDKKEVRSQLAARSDDALAQIDEVRTVAVDTQTAFASFSTTATATFGSLSASVTTNASAIATLNGYAAASYTVSLDVNGNAIGFELLNGGAGTSAFNIAIDKFQLSAPSVAGGAPQPVFTVITSGGVPKTGIVGDLIQDGSITSLGTVTTGRLLALSGKVDFNLNAGTLIISD